MFKTIVTQFLVYGQGFISVPILIKILGLNLYGNYILNLTIVGWLVGMGSIGLCVKARLDILKANREERNYIFKRQLIINTSFVLVIFFMAAGLIKILSISGSVIYKTEELMALLAYSISNVWYSVIADYFRDTEEFQRFNAIIMAQPVLQIILLISYANILGDKNGSIKDLLLLQAFSFAVVGLVALSTIIKRNPNRLGVRKFHFDFLANVKISMPLIFTFILDSLALTGERLIIFGNINAETLGAYTPTFMLASISILLAKIVIILYRARIGDLILSGKIIEANSIVRNLESIYIKLALGFAMFLNACGVTLLEYFSLGVIDGIESRTFLLIGISVIFLGLVQIKQMIMTIQGKTKSILAVTGLINMAYLITLYYATIYYESILMVPMGYLLWQLALYLKYESYTAGLKRKFLKNRNLSSILDIILIITIGAVFAALIPHGINGVVIAGVGMFTVAIYFSKENFKKIVR